MSNLPPQQEWSSFPQPGQPDAGFDFVGMLQRRLWIIVLCVLLATGGGVFWFWKSDVVYASKSRVHIYFQNPNVSIMGNDGYTVSNTINSHDELMLSESVLRNAANEILRLIQKDNQRINELAMQEDGELPGLGVNSPNEADPNTESDQDQPLAGNQDDPSTEKLAIQDPMETGEEKTAGEDESDEDLATRRSFAYLRDKSARQITSHLLDALTISPDREDPNIYEAMYSGPSRKDCHVILGIVIAEYAKHLDSKYENEGKEVVEKIRVAQVNINEDLQKVRDKLKRWRNVDRKDELREFAEGFLFNEDNTKSNRYRAEAQALYTEIAALEKERGQLSDEMAWIKEARVSSMSKQEILTHIDKFSEWLQIEQRKSATVQNKPETMIVGEFVEPDVPPALVQARFDVTTKKLEIKELIERGFGPRLPERRKLESELELMEANLKSLEESYQRKIELARADYEERKKQADALAAVDTSELPKILSEIDLIGLHESFLNQRLTRIRVDLEQLKKQRADKLVRAQMVDVLLQEELELEREIKMLEELNTSIAQKIQELDIETDNGGYALDILNSPSYAEQTEPSMLKIFAITTFIGMVVGTGLGYLVEIADKTFRTPSEIAQQLGMRVMGHVPILSTRKVDAKDSKLHESLIAYHLPKSQQAESFRAIRTNLFFNAQGKDSQIIQITSPTPGDGKSTLAANLAVSIAQSGKRVLLLDADLRRPTVDYLFNIDSEQGFASILSGDSTIKEAVFDCEVDGLQLMPVGKRPPNPAELLTSTKLFDFFETLREKYDFIIIDSPPMLAVTDPCSVAARADGVILAMRIKKNVKLSAGRAKEVLDSVNANIMGIVVNGAGMVQGHYSNSAAYGYGYGYGYGSGYAGNYYSYGYDYGESSYYYDDEQKPTAARRG